MNVFYALIASAGLLLPHTGVHAEPHAVPRMTGQESVGRYFNSVQVSSVEPTAKALLERELALGYLAKLQS